MTITPEQIVVSVNTLFPDGIQSFEAAMADLLKWAELRRLQALRDARRDEQAAAFQTAESAIQQVEAQIAALEAEIKQQAG